MDSIDPTYPPFSSSDESTNSPSNYPRSNPSPPSTDAADRASQPTAAPSFDGWSPNLLPQPSQPHLYSPTRAEIESHPIRQRLSTSRDGIVTGYGSASEPPEQDFSKETSEERSLAREQKQAQEGSETLFDAMSSEAPAPQVGDAVTYAWGSGQPGGTVTQVESNAPVTMETKNGNEVKKHGEPENPALYIARDGHDVVKKASEVEVEEKGDKQTEGEPEKKTDTEEKKEEEKKEEEKKPEENGEPQTGDKRPAEESAEEKNAEETNGEAKKQKTDDEPKENGEKPKKKGRPGKTDADGNPIAKKETKKRPPKKAATESGEPRRSGRNASKSS